MKTFSINTLGCKVNQYESQQIRELLENFGFRIASPTDEPDLIIINTCCVTHTASAKSRQQIRKFQKHHPEAKIVVCGCLPAAKNDTSLSDHFNFTKPAQNIHMVTNRDNLAAILKQITHRINCHDYTKINKQSILCENLQSINQIKPEFDAEIKDKKETCENLQLPVLTRFKDQTRAFLKIQDGCDAFCTYCIIPHVRSQISSKPVKMALDEAQSLVRAGHKEIVITGICLGAYGRDSARNRSKSEQNNEKLAELLEKMAKIANLERIRLSSLEPSDITDYLLETMSRHKNIMPHIHLSLQSGSDVILRKMCRKYRISEVREKINQIKNLLDKPAITTDIIVGFPGETDHEFENTYNFAKEAGFSKMHIFKFSPRKNTPASRMKDTIDHQVINERSKILHQLDKENGYNFRNQFIGQNETVLIEQIDKQAAGRSERYFMININNKEDSKIKLQKNDLVKVKLLKNHKDYMTGIII